MKPALNKKLNEFIKKEIIKELLKEFKNIKSVDDLDSFFSKFMTGYEKNLIFRRIAAMKLIDQGKKYREIKKLLDVSANTISKAKDILEGRGYSKNPNRKRKYSTLSVAIPRKPKRRRGLRYKGMESITNVLDFLD